ncbi:MAG: hypothetical protein IKE00_01385 [Oscillospiraceae bacterium]|nr:hypothetical protein [Oscillospiraceae bacterium]
MHKPSLKMILTQNLVFNLPVCLIMTLTAVLASGAGFNPGVILQFIIGLVVIEILGLLIPAQKIATAIGRKCFPGRSPMQLPQFMLPAAVLTILFTVPMTLIMTFFGMKMGGAPMAFYWSSVLRSLPLMLLAAYVSVLIFLPLSLKVSGIARLSVPPEK